MRHLLLAASDIWQAHGQTLVITAGLDGIHAPGSMHYYGYALDLRTHYFTPEEQTQVFKEMRERLGARYYVLLEKTHMHVQWQFLEYGNPFMGVTPAQAKLALAWLTTSDAEEFPYAAFGAA